MEQHLSAFMYLALSEKWGPFASKMKVSSLLDV